MIEFIATVLGIGGAWLVAEKIRYGFLCWIVGNFLWIAFSVINNHWWMGIQFSIFWILAVRGWVRWKT